MSEIQEHVAHLSQDIGPRPAGTEEEQQAALYLAEEMRQKSGFASLTEEFNCSPNNEVPRIVFCGIIVIMTVLAICLPVLIFPAFIVTLVCAILFCFEASRHSLFARFLQSGISQNVVAKYEPASTQGVPSARRRKIVLVAHYDSGRVRSGNRGIFLRLSTAMDWIELVAVIAIPVLFLVSFLFHASGVFLAVMDIVLVVCAVLILIPLVLALMDRFSPYNEAANCNASGVAVLMEAAARIGNGMVSAEDQGTYDAEGREAVIHGEQAARAAGYVPEGAELVYEEFAPDGRPAESESPAERLAAAKATLAAFSGMPVGEEANVEPGEDAVSEGGRSPQADQGAQVGQAVRSADEGQVRSEESSLQDMQEEKTSQSASQEEEHGRGRRGGRRGGRSKERRSTRGRRERRGASTDEHEQARQETSADESTVTKRTSRKAGSSRRRNRNAIPVESDVVERADMNAGADAGMTTEAAMRTDASPRAGAGIGDLGRTQRVANTDKAEGMRMVADADGRAGAESASRGAQAGGFAEGQRFASAEELEKTHKMNFSPADVSPDADFSEAQPSTTASFYEEEITWDQGGMQGSAPDKVDELAGEVVAAEQDVEQGSSSSEGGVPSWFTTAQEKAKKPTAAPSSAQRSRYGDALDAAVRESSAYFQQANDAVSSEVELRLQQVRDNIMEVKAPNFETLHAAMAAEESTEESAEGAVEEGAKEGSEVSAQSAAEEVAQGAAEGAVEEGAPQAAQGAAEGAVSQVAEGTAQTSAERPVQQTVEGYVQESLEEATPSAEETSTTVESLGAALSAEGLPSGLVPSVEASVDETRGTRSAKEERLAEEERIAEWEREAGGTREAEEMRTAEEAGETRGAIWVRDTDETRGMRAADEEMRTAERPHAAEEAGGTRAATWVRDTDETRGTRAVEEAHRIESESASYDLPLADSAAAASDKASSECVSESATSSESAAEETPSSESASSVSGGWRRRRRWGRRSRKRDVTKPEDDLVQEKQPTAEEAASQAEAFEKASDTENDLSRTEVLDFDVATLQAETPDSDLGATQETVSGFTPEPEAVQDEAFDRKAATGEMQKASEPEPEPAQDTAVAGETTEEIQETSDSEAAEAAHEANKVPWLPSMVLNEQEKEEGAAAGVEGALSEEDNVLSGLGENASSESLDDFVVPRMFTGKGNDGGSNSGGQMASSRKKRSIDLPGLTGSLGSVPALSKSSDEGGVQRAPLADAAEGTSSIPDTRPRISETGLRDDAAEADALDDESSSSVSSAGSFAPIGATGAFAPVGDELVEDVAPDDVYVDDADDSEYGEQVTETGANVGPGYVDMPSSRASRFFGRFRSRRKKNQEEVSTNQWLDVDDDFEAREVGKARGSWESFREEDFEDASSDDYIEDRADDDVEYEVDEYVDEDYAEGNRKSDDYSGIFGDAFDDDFADEDGGRSSRGSRSWNGGSFSRESYERTSRPSARGRREPEDETAAPVDDFVQNQSDWQAGQVEFSGSDEQAFEGASHYEELVDNMRRIDEFHKPGINTEVWFVALGSELADNGGMKAFLDAHADELRGSIIVDLEGLGAGDLTFVDEEGTYRSVKGSSRAKRPVRKAAAALGMKVGSGSIRWKETSASYAARQGFQAMHLVGMQDGKPAYCDEGDDVIENISEDTMLANADFVIELLKNI